MFARGGKGRQKKKQTKLQPRQKKEPATPENGKKKKKKRDNRLETPGKANTKKPSMTGQVLGKNKTFRVKTSDGRGNEKTGEEGL